MKTRLYFECWKCHRTYSLFKEITDQQALIVPCPYCDAEAIVKLEPFKKEIKTVMRGESENKAVGEEYQFPDVIPTQPPEQGA